MVSLSHDMSRLGSLISREVCECVCYLWVFMWNVFKSLRERTLWYEQMSEKWKSFNNGRKQNGTFGLRKLIELGLQENLTLLKFSKFWARSIVFMIMATIEVLPKPQNMEEALRLQISCVKKWHFFHSYKHIQKKDWQWKNQRSPYTYSKPPF